MFLKSPKDVSSPEFSMLTPKGTEFVIVAQNLGQLRMMVEEQIDTYDRQTNGEYSSLLREACAKRGDLWSSYLDRLIQHQICLSGKYPCYSGGVGDTVHKLLKVVDVVADASPSFVKKTIQKVVRRISPSNSPSVRGCSTCGGTETMDPKKNNLGRAGTINKMLGGK